MKHQDEHAPQKMEISHAKAFQKQLSRDAQAKRDLSINTLSVSELVPKRGQWKTNLCIPRIGFIVIEYERNPDYIAAHISAIYVNKNYRRHGYAKQLLKAAENRVSKVTSNPVWQLEAFTQANTPSEGLFSQFGYEQAAVGDQVWWVKRVR